MPHKNPYWSGEGKGITVYFVMHRQKRLRLELHCGIRVSLHKNKVSLNAHLALNLFELNHM